MAKGKVVDMFSKKPMDEDKQNTAGNDYLANNGRYVGSITVDKAEGLRNYLSILNGRREQLLRLIDALEGDYQEHMDEVYDILRGDLKVKYEEFDPMTEDVYIDEHGSVFLVVRPEESDVH